MVPPVRLHYLHARIFTQVFTFICTYCPVEIGLERLTYIGTEVDEITEEICAVILANPAMFVGGTLQGTFVDIGITTITGTITPQQTVTSPNVATGMYHLYVIIQGTIIYLFLICFSAFVDFDARAIEVSLSAINTRDCVQIQIADDTILEPNEVFEVQLTTSTAGATLRSGFDFATVTIMDDDPRKCFTWSIQSVKYASTSENCITCNK